MSGMNRSVLAGRKMGMLTMALALLSGSMTAGGSPTQDAALGHSMLASVTYHHRTLRGGRASGAAAAKRASAKRRNVLKRQSNRR
jgi:hypothetical protein